MQNDAHKMCLQKKKQKQKKVYLQKPRLLLSKSVFAAIYNRPPRTCRQFAKFFCNYLLCKSPIRRRYFAHKTRSCSELNVTFFRPFVFTQKKMHAALFILLFAVLGGGVLGNSNEKGNFYLVQFTRPITVDLVRKLTAAIGYEPTEFVPRNALIVWIDATRLANATTELPTIVPQIRYVGVVDRQYRAIDIKASLASLRMQQRHFSKIASSSLEATASSSSLLQTNNSDKSAAAGQNFASRLSDAFERDASGSLVVQLLIKSRQSLRDDALRDIANTYSRTRVRLEKAPTTTTLRVDAVKTLLIANVHCDDAERVTTALLDDDRVIWVQLRTPYQPMNRWAVGSLLYEQGADQRTMPRRTILRGAKQLLSVSDTGVEVGTCMFRDAANRAVPYTKVQAVPVDTLHEKIRAYWDGTGGDFRDIGLGAGHGSHVCATALGKTTAQITTDYSGGAPDARLVFVDLLPRNGGDFLQVPLDIGATLFKFSYDCGAMVHSGSWGSINSGVYAGDEADIDMFCWLNRQFLPIFAAGNAGPDLGTIASPAYAKNVLAVGAAMNGAAAYALAGKAAGSPDDFTHDWVADFSSAGSSSFAIRKPDVVASGGHFVWSADNDAPTSVQCAQANVVLTGMAGTSMATPLVASAAVLLREYFSENIYPNSAQFTYAGSTAAPTASLLRAMIVASAVPMRGMYPRKPFASSAERINRSGFGRVALDRVLELNNNNSTVQTVVLSNEREEIALSEGQSAIWCVSLSGFASQDASADVIIALAYADYPSSPLAKTTLVNDLRLEVLLDGTLLSVNDLAAGARELRTNIERSSMKISKSEGALSIRVAADDIGFGQLQSFSLVLIVKRNAPANTIAVASISAPILSALTPLQSETCAKCTRSAGQKVVYVPRSTCTECGNGIVEAPLEQCDSSECCDPTTCRVLDDGTPCVVLVGECRVQGACRGAQQLCVPDANVKYINANDGSGNCVPSDSTTPPPESPLPTAPPRDICITRSVAEWRAFLYVEKTPSASSKRLCCAPLWSVFEMIRFEPLFVTTAQEYAAALLNSLQPGATVTAVQLMQIAAAGEFLEQFCTTGFITTPARAIGEATSLSLRSFNKPCSTTPPTPPNDDAATTTPPCVNSAAIPTTTVDTLSSLLCSNGAGTFDVDSNQCTCSANRQQGEPDCAHLSCSGHGASVYDYKKQKDLCTCLVGWSGESCSQCTLPSSGSSVVYHCIGVAQSQLATAPQRHYLQLVARSTVADRLSGKYYRSTIAKVVDGIPGSGSLDCWCRMPSEVPLQNHQKTHHAILAEAQQQYLAMLALGAESEAIFAAPPSSSSRRLDNGGEENRQQHHQTVVASRAAKIDCSAVIALALLLLLIEIEDLN